MYQTRRTLEALGSEASAIIARMPEAEESDETLMLRYAAGDVRSFETLYQRHELRLWRYLFRSAGNHATADELLQDVWFAVVQSAARYQPSARFTTWLFTLAHHRLIDRHRRRKPEQSLDAPDADGHRAIEQLAADEGCEPLGQSVSAQQADALLVAIAQLPAEQRDAFLLQAEGDLSVEEIALATQVSFETVKSRLRYARSRLREQLREYA